MDCREALKVAVTEAAEFMFRVQLPVPEQAPLQPANTEPSLLGVADKLTLVPLLKLEVHELVQSMPAGLLCTLPLPEPEKETVSSELPGCGLLVGGGGGVLAVSLDLPPAQPASIMANAKGTTVRKRGDFDIGNRQRLRTAAWEDACSGHPGWLESVPSCGPCGVHELTSSQAGHPK